MQQRRFLNDANESSGSAESANAIEDYRTMGLFDSWPIGNTSATTESNVIPISRGALSYGVG